MPNFYYFSLSDIVQILLSIIGFIIAFTQLSRIKKSADAAKKASEDTTEKISDRISLTDITTIYLSMREAETALRGNRVESALIRVQECRNQLAQTRTRLFKQETEKQTKIQEIITSLAELEKVLENQIETKKGISITKINTQISKHMNTLSEWKDILLRVN